MKEGQREKGREGGKKGVKKVQIKGWDEGRRQVRR